MYAKGETIPPKVINDDRFFDKSNAAQLISGSLLTGKREGF